MSVQFARAIVEIFQFLFCSTNRQSPNLLKVQATERSKKKNPVIVKIWGRWMCMFGVFA